MENCLPSLNRVVPAREHNHQSAGGGALGPGLGVAHQDALCTTLLVCPQLPACKNRTGGSSEIAPHCGCEKPVQQLSLNSHAFITTTPASCVPRAVPSIDISDCHDGLLHACGAVGHRAGSPIECIQQFPGFCWWDLVTQCAQLVNERVHSFDAVPGGLQHFCKQAAHALDKAALAEILLPHNEHDMKTGHFYLLEGAAESQDFASPEVLLHAGLDRWRSRGRKLLLPHLGQLFITASQRRIDLS
mmetsp:Transcript_70159/g.121464  ORF Transcript_70159/g.121464 Transcript_70159/m.121464 type:complete len:245 (-) Transcript_70159:832-1566(-)